MLDYQKVELVGFCAFDQWGLEAVKAGKSLTIRGMTHGTHGEKNTWMIGFHLPQSNQPVLQLPSGYST